MLSSGLRMRNNPTINTARKAQAASTERIVKRSDISSSFGQRLEPAFYRRSNGSE
jgi:hypothetical protein